MATNALAPKPKNALTRQADPMQSLLRQSAEYPQYGELVDYLSARRMMPPISFEGLSGGSFAQNTVFGNTLPKTGVVKVGYHAGPDTVVHELTHAADDQLSSQYYDLKNKRNLTPLEQQFLQAYEKLAYNSRTRDINEKLPRVNLADKLDPQWASKQGDYRSTSVELPAWGMGAAVDPSSSRRYAAPLHLDPTMATEFSILLDMARKLQKSQPVTDKR
jgi:hypothetical protein